MYVHVCMYVCMYVCTCMFILQGVVVNSDSGFLSGFVRGTNQGL